MARLFLVPVMVACILSAILALAALRFFSENGMFGRIAITHLPPILRANVVWPNATGPDAPASAFHRSSAAPGAS